MPLTNKSIKYAKPLIHYIDEVLDLKKNPKMYHIVKETTTQLKAYDTRSNQLIHCVAL